MSEMQIEQIQTMLNQVVIEITQAAQHLATQASQVLSSDSILTQGGVKLTESDRNRLQTSLYTTKIDNSLK